MIKIIKSIIVWGALFSLFVVLLAECGGNSTSPIVWLSNSSSTSECEDESQIESTLSCFSFPEETDNLILYSFWFHDDALQRAAELFREKYPDVRVELQSMDVEEFADRLRTELPAGRGPDVFFDCGFALPDIYKTMSTGIFTDLAPYMANDEEYRSEEYYDTVLKGGVMFGKQFIIPLTFGLNTLLTSEELLAQNGISADSFLTWEGFLEACTVFHEKKPGSRLIDRSMERCYIPQIFKGIGFRMIDYDHDAVSFDEIRFKQMLDLCWMYCYPDQPDDLPYGGGWTYLKTGDCLFLDETESSTMVLMNSCAGVRDVEQTPILLHVPNEDGGVTAEIKNFAAIPEASKNKLNAWRFIKVLLSPEIQGGREGQAFYPVMTPGFSVRRESLRQVLTETRKMFACTDEDIKQALSLTERVTDSVMLPHIVMRYVTEYMIPFVTGQNGFIYEEQLDKLVNTLKLYKDE